MKIIRNSVKCLKCNDEIISTHVHDFKWCSCKNIAVDGGNEYLKRAGDVVAQDTWTDTSLYASSKKKK
jgi:Zn finger protein HypA/HybF involved in hydrogenase expression